MDLCSSSNQKDFAPNRSCTSFDDPPDGLVSDILSRLPVKTLVLSTSVCRIWYSIVKSPSFISAHFSRSGADPCNYFIFLIHTFSPSVTLVSDNHLLTHNEGLNFNFETRSKSQHVIGTCNGLICLTDSYWKYYGRDIYLFNPFIHKYKKLSVESSCYADLIAQINITTGDGIEVGFGCSNVENDYKVVRIINQYSDAERSVRTSKVEIYSLKSGTWKVIDASFDTLPSYSSSVFVHGCLYWGFFDIPHPEEPFLPDGHFLCFELNDEVFSKIELPAVYYQLCCTWQPHIFTRNGSVVVVVTLGTVDPDTNFTIERICLLLLEKGIDGQVQWKEFYYDSIVFNATRCFGFSVYGRLLFCAERIIRDDSCKMVAVDLDNSCAIEKLALGINGTTFSVGINAVESLILLLD